MAGGIKTKANSVSVQLELKGFRGFLSSTLVSHVLTLIFLVVVVGFQLNISYIVLVMDVSNIMSISVMI